MPFTDAFHCETESSEKIAKILKIIFMTSIHNKNKSMNIRINLIFIIRIF